MLGHEREQVSRMESGEDVCNIPIGGDIGEATIIRRKKQTQGNG